MRARIPSMFVLSHSPRITFLSSGQKSLICPKRVIGQEDKENVLWGVYQLSAKDVNKLMV